MDLLNSKKYMQQPSTPSPPKSQRPCGFPSPSSPSRLTLLDSPVNHRLPTQTAHIMPATPGQGPPELITKAQTSTTMGKETYKRTLPLSYRLAFFLGRPLA